ncbi:MAG: hypothetical protein NWE89_05585 [Candidatus Bathyarchaeota archaeon]|nr:hypothetical protein [Candidatus Bathyarchaeota archaeon]
MHKLSAGPSYEDLVSVVKLTPGDVEITRLTSKYLPDLTIDPTRLKEHVLNLLQEEGERDTVYLLIKLMTQGLGEVLGLSEELGASY